MASKSPSPQVHEDKKADRASHSLRWPLLVGGVIFFIIVALCLGLGLGLGLKHHSKSISSSSPPSSTPKTGSAATLPSWRRDPTEYDLDRSWDLNAAPTTRIFNFTVSEIQAAPDGVFRTMYVINGQFPAPLIRVNQGDRILVNLTNQLSDPTSLHWHGLFQNGTNWMDGTVGITQCPVPPGKSFLYNFTVENQFGTYWYHSHYSTQYTDGIVGPLIVHAPEEATIQQGYDLDQVILIQDWYHDLSSDLLPAYLASGNENTEPTPDSGMIDGTNYFDCSQYGADSGYTCQDNSTRAVIPVTQGKRYRFRIINTGSFAEFQFSVDNHTLTVIEADSTLVEPVTVHRLPIHIAQRYSVILNANQEATNYWMRAQLNEYCFSSDNPVLDPDIRALVTYVNSTNTTTDLPSSVDWADALDLVCEDLSTSMLIPYDVKAAPERDNTFVVDVSFQIGAYALDKAYINSTTWVAADTPTLNQAVSGLPNNTAFSTLGLSSAFSASQFVISVPTTQTIDLLVNSLDEGAHPFHLHGHEFWILAEGKGRFDWSSYPDLNTTNPMRRDTMTINAYGWTLIRFVADNPGLWAFHCHISWHMEAGLLMQFQTRSDLMKNWTLPSDVVALCDG